MKKLAIFLLAGVTAVLVVLAARTVTFASKQLPLEAAIGVEIDAGAAANRFAGAIRFPTVSYLEEGRTDSSAFRGLHGYLEEVFPLVHQQLRREVVSELSLLYTWQGTSADLDPIVLMGHLDVVPVIPGTESDWEHPPFGGEIDGEHVWGRGTMDDKVSVLAILEAVEHLLGDGYVPRRTIYLAFGHDEEIGGVRGAQAMADLIAERHRDLAFVLDEGGAVADGMVPGVPGPAALIGIAEKGYLSLELLVEGEGGHSSMPPPSTNIGILSDAITELEEHPFSAKIGGATRTMFEHLGPEMGFGARVAFANMWLTGPLVKRQLLGNPQTAAMVRTTTAVTMIAGGVKDNVLPISARAVVNFRIIPGETRQSVTERVQEIIDDDRVQIRPVASGQDPSPVSSAESDEFKLITRTIRQIVPDEDLVIAPYLVMGGTDAKYYAGKSENVFRFLAARLGEGDIERVHGTNERMSVESFAASINFFIQLVRNSEELN